MRSLPGSRSTRRATDGALVATWQPSSGERREAYLVDSPTAMRKARGYSSSSLVSLLVGCVPVLVWMSGCGGSTGSGHNADASAGSASADASLSDLAAEGGVQSDVQSATYNIMPTSDAEPDAAPDVATLGPIYPPCHQGCCQTNGNGSCKTDCNQCTTPCATPALEERDASDQPCDATTCPMGCCDTHGQCVFQGAGSQRACGLCGARCIDCTLGGSFPGLFCRSGVCDQPHG
jgi:hypothetical protein